MRWKPNPLRHGTSQSRLVRGPAIRRPVQLAFRLRSPTDEAFAFAFKNARPLAVIVGPESQP